MSDDTSPRRLPPDACTWCGHEPHRATCTRTIRTAKNQAVDCACRREGSR